jgi:hypothetical protein
MRWGLIFGGLLILVTIAAIVALCLRPATVIGVSPDSLAASVEGAADADEARCLEIESDSRFACAVRGTDGRVQVEVDDFGCWDGKGREDLDGCITIADLIRSGG